MGNEWVLMLAILTVCLLEYVDLGSETSPFVGRDISTSSGKPSNDKTSKLKALIHNIMLVEDHNSLFEAGESSFKMKLNKFAHVPSELFTRTRNGFKKETQSTIPQRLRNIFGRVMTFVSPLFVELTATVDWRRSGVDFEVLDQKECASCWAFSTLGAIEGQISRLKGAQVHLSSQNLIDCATSDYGSYGCDGGSMEGAYQYIKEYGINSANRYPYEAKVGTCRHQNAFNAVVLAGYRKIQRGNETQLSEAVATIGPIAVAIDASLPTFQFYSQGIYYDPDCSNSRLDHGVLVVGYGTTARGDDYWIVKNSFGQDWGENGYIRIARNKENHCGIASSASYPII